MYKRQRRHRAFDLTLGSLFVLPGLAIAGAGLGAAIASASLAGGAYALAFGALSTFATGNFLMTGLKARGLNNHQDQSLSGKFSATPKADNSEARLRENLERGQQKFPGSKHVDYLSGHGGDRKTLAGLKLTELREKMAGSKADITILDTCSSCSLEVMGNLAPWAGLVVASTLPVLASGYPLREVFSPENLQHTSNQDLAVNMSHACSKWTLSMNVVDTETLKTDLLPSLDRLGKELQSESNQDQSRAIRRALRKSKRVGLLGLGGHKYLHSFLENLGDVELSSEAQEALKASREFLIKSVIAGQNDRGLSFHPGGDASLPAGWNSFLEAI